MTWTQIPEEGGGKGGGGREKKAFPALISDSFQGFIRQVLAATKVSVRASRALVCQRNHRCIRQVIAILKGGVHDSTALVCQRNHCCIRQIRAAIKLALVIPGHLSAKATKCVPTLHCHGRRVWEQRAQASLNPFTSSAAAAAAAVADAAAADVANMTTIGHEGRLPPPGEHFSRNVAPPPTKSKCTFRMSWHKVRHRLQTCGTLAINVLPFSCESTLSTTSGGIR